MKIKTWLISWFLIVISVLSVLAYWVFRVDPYFHYHKPDLSRYYYTLDNERSQNDGILKHFDYDMMITGTSMTENFMTSEADRIFGGHFVKTAFAGGSYKEINDNIATALRSNHDLRLIIRGLDTRRFCDSADAMSTNLGVYPTYLYDRNPFNDVKYLFNRDVIFGRIYQMTLANDTVGFLPGITSFDEYARWQSTYHYGLHAVYSEGIPAFENVSAERHLTKKEKNRIKENIELNVTAIADQYPDVDFYYFYTPYSIAWWAELYQKGTLSRQLEAERYITELILPHRNIRLFSFSNRTDIITDLNNYKDTMHYASWINSLILKWMHDGEYQLTADNYKNYLAQEYDFLTAYPYESIPSQTDYDADFYAGALLNRELTGMEPQEILNAPEMEISINKADFEMENGRRTAVLCHGALRADSSQSLTEYIRDEEFIGVRFEIDLDKGYNYLSFDGQKIRDQGCLTAYVFSEEGTLIGAERADYSGLDDEIRHYVIDLSKYSGTVTAILNGGYVDHTGSAESEYRFSNIVVY